MKKVSTTIIFLTLIAACSLGAAAPVERPIKLAGWPAVSPDGKTLAFGWNGDIWTVPMQGGLAKRFTHSDGYDQLPSFAPDGKRLAFSSDRNGRMNTFVAPIAGGGASRQISFHSEGETLLDWAPDGKSVLYQGRRDHTGHHSQRLFLKSVDGTTPERLLFDAAASGGRLSPDGTKVLFTREGGNSYRKGYVGSKSSQIWIYDLETKTFEKLIAETFENRYPMWKLDGSGFYFVGGKSGIMNLWEYTFKKGARKQLTFFTKDAVMYPNLSRDGSVIVFRHLFDFYRYHPTKGGKPERIDVRTNADVFDKDTELKSFKSATALGYSRDNLEILVVAGGDLWVIDTLMKEPVRIVESPDQVRDAFFSKDNSTVYYILDDGITANVHKATRADATKPWWENREFALEEVTDFKEPVSMMRLAKNGKTVTYCRGMGDLYVADADFGNPRKIISSRTRPDYDVSNDGTWIAMSLEDNNFNRDIWIMPIDGSMKPFNVSRNPKWDGDPAWSPDGKILAWVGQNLDSSRDVFYLYLTKEKAEESSWDRKLQRARKLMENRKKKKTAASPPKDDPKAAVPASKTSVTDDAAQAKPETEEPKPDTADKPEETPKPKKETMTVDFDRILERVRRIANKEFNEYGLIWANDSKRLIFRNNKGKKGTYEVSFPDNFKPVFLNASLATWWTWDARGRTLYGIEKGVPASLVKNKVETVPFTCLMKVSKRNENRLLYNKIWRTMRDWFYRDDMNGCDWPAIHKKYAAMAVEVPDAQGLRRVVNLMLGELNASHTGFFPNGKRPANNGTWSVYTAHAGLTFDPEYPGPGLKVAEVIPDGPIYLNTDKIEPGELVMAVNGVDVGNDTDWVPAFNGPKDQTLRLLVKNGDGQLREVRVRSATFGDVRHLRFKNRLRELKTMVEEKSDGRFAYVHVRGMDWSSFEKFQKQIFARGFGKEGLVIDVRDNGGGFTADHLLTVLTQPRHSVTVPRGGGPGYPLDRSVYVYWDKPIVVLCNQNSFSNAEIFCHAIKTLERGKIVGVRTAGGVISAGSRNVDGKGTLRLPFRGWYTLKDNTDMELNGAMPDFEIWPEPGDLANGKDPQLEKAIDVLKAELE